MSSIRIIQALTDERKAQILCDIYASCAYDPETQCLLWQRGRSLNGYGNIRLTELPHTISPHRVICAISYPQMTQADHVLHACDTPACTASWHLTPGTHAENMRDMTRKGRHGSQRRQEWLFT